MAKSAALQPRRLAGADQLGAPPGLHQRIDQQPGRRALADGGVGPEHATVSGADLRDLAGEEVQLGARRRLADVAQRDALRGLRGPPAIADRRRGSRAGRSPRSARPRSPRATSARAVAGSRPPSGASPITRCVGRPPISCANARSPSSRLATTGIAGGLALEDLARHRARRKRESTSDSDDVASRAPDEPVRRLAVGRAERTLAVDDGVPVRAHQRRPVMTATKRSFVMASSGLPSSSAIRPAVAAGSTVTPSFSRRSREARRIERSLA